jgi:diguanylate cyclase (GGDEF)-like protein/PAS domain S-box-containing protein
MNTENRQIDIKSHILVQVMAIAIICISLVALIGTLLNSTLLSSLSPHWINIKINTILCFMLTGAGMLFANYKGRIVLFCIGMIIFLISGVTLFEYLAVKDLGIDQLIMKDIAPNSPNTVFAGRMSFITAVNFMLVASMFFMLSSEVRPIRVIQFFAWLIALVSVISLFNYLYGAQPPYHYAKYSTMSMITIVLFFLVSIGMLLISPDVGIVGILLRKNNTGYMLRRVVLIPIIIPILLLQIDLILQNKDLINAFVGIVITQIGLFVIIGGMIVLVSNILEHKENLLEEAESKVLFNEITFRKFADNIDIVFYTTSPDLNEILYVSAAYERIWGKSAQSLYENPMDWYDSIVPEDKKKTYDVFFGGLKEGRENISVEYRIQRPDGTIRNIFGRIYQVKDEKNSNLFAIVGIAVDLTEITVEKLHNQLQYELAVLVENEKDLNHFLHMALTTIGRTLNFDYCAIWMIDETEGVLRCVDAWYKESKSLRDFELFSRQYSYKIGEELPGSVWQTKQPIWISDYAASRIYFRSGFADNAGLNSVFGMPIIYQDKIVGVIEIFSKNVIKPNYSLSNHMETLGKSIGEFVVLKMAAEKNLNLSRKDYLTNLLNRPSFEKDLNSFIITNKSRCIAILVVDIDKFKLINEGFGHDAGDTLLKLVATRLSASTLQIPPILARLGADKYIMAIPESDQKTTLYYAQGIMHMLHEPFELGSVTVNVSISIGVAVYPQDGLDAKSLVANADLALHKAKNLGGGKISFFTKDLPFVASKTILMQNELRQAIMSDQFILEYQPQIDLKTSNLCGAEALVRWQHPTRGLLYPKDFIFYAEDSELIVSLNELIIRKVFAEISLIKIEIPLSVNISSQQLENGFHFVEFLESLIIEFSIDVKQIELEITENMLVKDTDHNIAVLTALSELGFKIAIDDFGTGFSSFSYLSHLPVDKVKIDRSFITGLPINLPNIKIVKAMIPLLHSLGKIVVAEGAETQAEVECLKQEKCDIVQGFYYYKPMSFEKLIAILDHQLKAIDH